MDAFEPAKIVYSKVQALEPDNVSKIMGYLLLEGNGNQEMLSLAFGPDSMLQSAIFKAKEELGLSSYRGLHPTNLIATEQWSSELSPNSSHPLQFYSDVSPYLSPLSPHLFPRYLNHLSTSAVSQVSQYQSKNLSTKSPLCLSPLYIPESHPYLHFSAPSSPWESGTKTEKSPKFSSNIALHQNQAFTNAFSPTDCRIQKLQGAIEQQDSPRGVFVDEQYHQLPSSPLNNRLSLNKSSSRLSPVGVSSSHAVPSLSWKPCLYFSRGYCKHGGSCRFMHTSMTEGSTSSSPRSELRDLHGEEGLQSGSVERLELELQELLHGKKAPVSIASLPQLYYEHFGKTLQADGYLTESRRHGKAGYSLTKLLARLKSTVTLIDRPHGQHAVVLAEDAHNYAEQDELKAANPSSRQIYLTFPAESTFTEEDVSLHFKAYGPVEDVRIPFQQRRMFGFVTFAYPETVKQILSGGNPHYICGARVLVKPYREKSKLNDRKHLTENIIYSLHGSSGSNNFSTQALAAFGNDSYFRELQEEQILELERKLAELKIKDAQQMHPESEAVTMYHDGVDPALTHSPNRAYMAQVELPSLTLHDDSLCNTYISEPNTVDPAAVHGFVPNGGYVSSLSTEDMHQLPSNDPFAYLLDVLDNDVGVDMMSSGAKDGAQTISGHNLPDSLFTSALAQDMDKPFHPSEILDLAQICQTGEFVAQSQIPVVNHSVTCCICLEYFVDPIRLECSHIFCLQCILKVIKSSKDECPVCQKHIGNQVYKIFQNIDQPSWLSGIQNQSVAQQIW